MVTSSPGNAIDIHSFNGKNYIKTFNDANAATTLKGYALGDESVLDAKFTATVVEVASGAEHRIQRLLGREDLQLRI